MGKLKLQGCIVGELSTNCYILQNTETQEAVIVDPGGSYDRIFAKIMQLQVKPAAILLTHGHFDHIMAVPELRKRFEIPVYALLEEEDLLSDPERNLSSWQNGSYTAPADIYLTDLQVFEAGGFSIQVLHTPGHTTGSCCYYLAEEGVLVSGDTLFQGSCGRTDFPGGSMAQMRRSLSRLMNSLPEETQVLPGHGMMTTIEHEKRYNPFV
ncbi:MAG: MBL fold metallo-hydrolase [Clostridiales bacterium]|nr:MBL fold metallo-hydrolase [Candidatus Blautia equi]